MTEARSDKEILFLTNGLGPGGAERMLTLEANALWASGYPVRFATLYGGDKGPQGTHQGWLTLPEDRTTDLGFRRLLDLRAWNRLIRYLKMNKVGVVYATLEESNVIARLLKFRMPGLCVITRESNDASRKSWKFKVLDFVLNPLASRIVAVSEGVRRSIVRNQPHIAHKVVVVENGTRVPAETVRSRTDTFTVLAVGSLTPKKDHLLLIDAFAKLHTSLPESRLVILGEGILRPALENALAAAGLESAVSLPGAVSGDEVAAWYRKADVFVLTSGWEGFPNVLLEAMAHGLPVVTTPVFGATELVEDGVNGLMLMTRDPDLLAEKLAWLHGNPEERERLGQSAHARMAERFTIERNVAALEEVITACSRV